MKGAQRDRPFLVCGADVCHGAAGSPGQTCVGSTLGLEELTGEF